MGLLARLSNMEPESRLVAKPYPHGLDRPLLRLGNGAFLNLGDFFEHFMCFGGTGSGKTTGVMRALLRMYLKMGFGGLVCTVKSDDTERIVRIAQETGRGNDVRIIRPGGPFAFNFLDYEFNRPGAGGGLIENAVSIFMEAIENRADGGKRSQGDSYWNEGVRRLLRHSMETLRLGGMPVSMESIKAIIDGMPFFNPAKGRPDYPPDSLLVECLGRAEVQGHDVRHLHAYWHREMARPGSDRQVAGIISTFTNMADPFLSGPVAELFACRGPSTWEPDVTRYGSIVILDLPVSEYGDVGRSFQICMKKIWIDALLRRQGLSIGERPCFLLCDEYQFLASPASDARLMQAGRSSWVSAFCLTQNLNNLYAAFEPQRGQYQALSMLGNFSTLIFCRNHDKTTNEWASETIAKRVVRRRNAGTSGSDTSSWGGNAGINSGHSSSPQGGSWSHGYSGGQSWQQSESYSTSAGWSEQEAWPVMPAVFTQLASGGPQNKYMVQTVLFKAGKRFPPRGQPFMGVQFPQR